MFTQTKWDPRSRPVTTSGCTVTVFMIRCDSFYMTELTFSGIIRRPDKPFLNQKIDSGINCQSEKMCLNKGHDFIDNNNKIR